MKMSTSDEYSPQGEGMTSPFFQQGFYDMSERRSSHDSPITRSPRFGSLRRRKRIEYFEDTTSEGSDGRTSSDEYDSTQSSKKLDDNNNNNNGEHQNQKHRKNSHFTISNVKKKITSTFQRRHSVAMHPPSPTTNPKQPPLRRSSTANHSSPRLFRQQAIDDHHPISTPKRKTSLRRHVTMAAVRLHEQSQVGSGSNPMLDRILQKSHFQMESSSSTPDIQSYARNSQLKTFNIHILGSKSVGKTAMTVRFLTGRYIHEYKSASEESYDRVMKYGDEQVNVKIFINDLENMERDIELDQNSGIMILYSIVDKTSYAHAKMILQYLSKSSITGYYPVMLIGTKRDLSRMRQVPKKDSFQIATQYSCTQFDVSSATDRRVKDCFHALFRQIEIRDLLHQNEDGCEATIINPPLVIRSGTVRYGTA